jgi:hypothetical protein
VIVAAADILARSHSRLAIKVLAGIAKDGTNEGARVAAAVALLDRGWGKPAQMHTGEDGEHIRITIRRIFEGEIQSTTDNPKPMIDVTPSSKRGKAGGDDGVG